MENHQKYGRFIYFHDDAGIFVNQFIASELDWNDRGVKLRQETGFPNEQGTTLVFECKKPAMLKVRVRTPYWLTRGATVKLNGELLPIGGEPGSYLVVEREWSDGDRLAIAMPFALRLESMPDDSNRVAVMFGPLVLAGDLGPVDDPEAGQPDYVPVLRTDNRDPARWLEAVEGQPNTFHMQKVGSPRNVTLKPFYATHDRRYTIFWDVVSEKEWNERRAARESAEKARRELAARTVDFVRPGEMQPERDHNMQGEHTSAGRYSGRGYRHAGPDGWFSYEVAVDANVPQALVVTYWGDEGIRREFDVLVDGEKVATQELSHNVGARFFDVEYPLEAERLKGKKRITVKFQNRGKTMVGGVFGLRVVRTKAD
jgi:hypothetical protein